MHTTTLQSWTDKALALIKAKVQDARAHASKAVTESLKQTPDGRPTARKARRSPSSQAAAKRLDELLDALAGPSVSGLNQGLIRDAREALYREAFDRWKVDIPEGLRRSLESPTLAAIAAARGLILHGYDLRSELSTTFDAQKTRLAAATVLAGSRGATSTTKVDLLGHWELAATNEISRVVALALGDSAVALDRIAGRDLVRPELLDASALEGV